MASLDRDLVFGALTRPQMFAGVTYSYFVLNAVVTLELFLLTKSFWALLVALVLHVVGYLGCLKEPRFFDLWLTRQPLSARAQQRFLALQLLFAMSLLARPAGNRPDHRPSASSPPSAPSLCAARGRLHAGNPRWPVDAVSAPARLPVRDRRYR